MSSSNTNSRGGNKRKDVKLVEKLRNACPPHRINDIETLVKQYKGDENKISLAIQEWWEEEPESKEAEWQDVNKRVPKKTGNQNHNRQFQSSGGHRSDRDRGGRDNSYRSSSGRGFHGRGMGGGRGAGAERRSRDYGRDRDRNGARNGGNKSLNETDTVIGSYVETKTEGNQMFEQSSGPPAPIMNVSQLKVAWGQNENSYRNVSASDLDKGGLTAPDLVDDSLDTTYERNPPGVLGFKPMKPLEPVLTSSDDGFGAFSSNRTPSQVLAPTTGNVWATKGSAHLIQQEAVKQNPPPTRYVGSGDKKSRRDHGGGSRKNLPNKLRQSQSHNEPELISDTTTMSTSVTSEPVVVPETAEVTTNNDAPHTSIPSSLSNPSDALDVALESLLPAAINGTNMNASGWTSRAEVEASSTQIPEIPHPTVGAPSVLNTPALETSIEPNKDVLLDDVVRPIDLSIPIVEVDAPVAPPVSQLPVSTVLLGAWDVSGSDEAGLDFGFGSFGNDNDGVSVEEPQIDPPKNINSHKPDIPAPSTTAMSPARPPPGLSIGGMPPMPANAVPVHELEGKLESITLGVSAQQHSEDSNKNVDISSGSTPLTSANGVGSSLSDKNNAPNDLSDDNQNSQVQPPHLVSATHPDSANPMLANQSYGAAYGIGIYNYNGAANVSNGFMGIHAPNAPVLGGVLPQQPQQQKLPQQATNTNQQQGNSQGGLPQHLHQGQQPQGGIYGGTPSNNANVGASGSEGAASSGGDNPNSAGIPPGMPGAIPYNPALFYGQQYYQMGQPHGGVGYGHAGYGQFGAGVQSGFGYQQVMGQNGGYGQPYDDSQQQHHSSHNNPHSSNSHQNYQKNNHAGTSSGGYRARNNHHNTNHHASHSSGGHQYQNQYNPQHGGYGAQPYNMGYGVDQFGNRGGYVPGNMDQYAMQQNNPGYQSSAGHSAGGNFSQDESEHQLHHNKGKSKGGSNRGNNNSFAGGNHNIQQFQQIPPQHQGGQAQQQQGFGFQGSVSETSSAGGTGGSSNGGWPNQGWTGTAWQGNN